MTDELIEKVAKTIADVTDFDGDRMASRYADSELRDVARAAIRVIAPAVLEQAVRQAAETNANCYGDPTDVYETMIDAIRALKEGYSHDQ